jgi:hypothetical protein
MAATKCSYNVYGKTAKQAKLDLDLKLYGVSIPKETNPKYLGVTLDPTLSFSNYIDIIVQKCKKRMNLLKTLRANKINVNNKTKKTICFSLISSNIEYAAPI